jgi:5-methylcytosine-specific restriction protein A
MPLPASSPAKKDILPHKKPHENKRSSHWPTLRKKFLQGKVCAVCANKKDLEAHHIRPFHLHPELELKESNLIPLCEMKKDGINCHLLIGHLGSFESFNINVVKDAAAWNKKIKDRPDGKEA